MPKKEPIELKDGKFFETQIVDGGINFLVRTDDNKLLYFFLTSPHARTLQRSIYNTLKEILPKEEWQGHH